MDSRCAYLQCRSQNPLRKFFEKILHEPEFAEAHKVAGKFDVAVKTRSGLVESCLFQKVIVFSCFLCPRL